MGLLEALRSVVRGSRVARAFALAGAPPPQPGIHFDSSGLGITFDVSAQSEPETMLAWVEIVEAIAFKRDLFTTDLVCLRFATVRGTELEVNEEMGGWSAMLETLPSYLPGCMKSQQVLEAVIQPAFVSNETVVFRRVS